MQATANTTTQRKLEPVAPPVIFSGDRLSVHFNRFDAPAYSRFLQLKRLPETEVTFHPDSETYSISAPKRFAAILGETLPGSDSNDLPFSPFLFNDQAAIVRMALDAKRFACWSDCGLGKTLITLEFARHVIHKTGGRFLIVTMNEIVGQFIEECQKFYGDSMPIRRMTTRSEMKRWCETMPATHPETGPELLAITNYEKFNPGDELAGDGQVVNECRYLAGFAADESSRLKAGGGKQKWAIIKSTKGIEYKLSCTAAATARGLAVVTKNGFGCGDNGFAESITLQVLGTIDLVPKPDRMSVGEYAKRKGVLA